MVKLHPTKLPRIGKDERLMPLVENEMIVFRRPKVGRLDAQFAGHTEVKPEPIITGKAKKHAFAARFRPQQALPGEILAQPDRIGPAKNVFSWMQGNLQNAMSNSDVPASAKKFDFRQFWHRAE